MTALSRTTHWGFIALAYFTLLAQSLIDNGRGPAYPDILTTFDLSSTSGAKIFALASFAALFASLSTKWWLPKLELIRGSIVSLFLMTVACFLFGRSPLIGTWLLDLSSFLMGLGMGGANVCMNLLIAKGTSPIHRRQFYAGLHSVYGLGSLSAPLILSFYLTQTTDKTWGDFYQYLCLLPATILLIALIRYPALTKLKVAPTEALVPKAIYKAPVPLLMRLAYGTVFGFYVASEVIISSRLVYYLNEGHQLPITESRMALSVFFLALLAGRLLFTITSIKGQSHHWLIFSCLTTIAIYFSSRIFYPPLLALTGLSMSYFYPVAMDWLANTFTEGLEWMTASVLTSVSVFLVVMHLGFGYVTDRVNIEAAMAIVPLLLIFTIIMVVILEKAKAKIQSKQAHEN